MEEEEKERVGEGGFGRVRHAEAGNSKTLFGGKVSVSHACVMRNRPRTKQGIHLASQFAHAAKKMPKCSPEVCARQPQALKVPHLKRKSVRDFICAIANSYIFVLSSLLLSF